MNEEALKDAHDLFVKTGYKGDINEFKNLLSTNPSALKDAHSLFVSTGYKKDINSFSELVGITPIKKKEVSTSKNMESATETGYSASQKTYKLQGEKTILPKDDTKIADDLYGAPQENTNANYKTKTTYINQATGKPMRGPIGDMVDAKRLKEKELTSAFNVATKSSEKDDIEVLDRFKTEENGGGFFGGLKQGLINAYNTTAEVVGRVAGIHPDEVKSAQIENRIPFQDEIREVKQSALQNKEKLSNSEIEERAKNLFVEKQKYNIYVDKANSFLDNLPQEDKKLLELDRYDKISSLGEQNKKILKVQAALKSDFKTKFEDYNEIKSQIEYLHKNNQPIPKDLLVQGMSMESDLKTLSDNANKNYNELLKNKSDLGTAEQELDLFKRENRDWVNIGKTIAVGFGDLGTGLLDFTNWAGANSGDPLSKIYSINGEKMTSELRNQLSNAREKLRKPVESIESPEGFINYVSDVMANQAPILAATATGYGGLGIIGVSSTGQQYGKMNDEVAQGKASYSPLQMATVPLLYGSSEVVSEVPTLSILKKGGRVLASIEKGSSDLIKKSVKEKAFEWAKDYGIDMSKELAGEEFTQFTQNFTDKYILGKKDVNLLDGTGQVFKDTFTLTSILKTAPHMAGVIVRPFQSKNQLNKLDENSRQLVELSKQLETEGLTETEKIVIKKHIDKLTTDSSKIMANTIDKMGNMPKELYDEVVFLNKKAGEIKAQAREIQLDSKLSNKEDLIKGLEEEYKLVQNKRESVLNGSTSIVDVLPLQEQDKLKRQAMEDLVTELNPDGTKDMTISNEQVLERANKIYTESKQNEANQKAVAEQKSETQPQAEAQKTEQESVSAENAEPIQESTALENAETPNTNEATPTNANPSDGNVSVGDNVVEQSGVSEQQNTSPEGLQSANDTANTNGKNEVNAKEQDEFDNLLSGEAEKRRSIGSYVKDGITYVRNEVKKVITGKKDTVKFADKVEVPFEYALMEANEVQPSHLNGKRNPNFFITEAQPKNRKDDASKKASDEIGKNPKLKEAGENSNAYSGAPIVNERGEVIQGNNRAEGLKKHYSNKGTSYKEQLKADAEKYGLTPEQIDAMENPILVRKIAVNDAKAIELGNHDVKDLETGGNRRIDPVAISRRIPKLVKSSIMDILFKDNSDQTLNKAVRDKLEPLIKSLLPYLNEAQVESIIRKDGTPRPSGVEDLEKLVQHFLFDGGNVNMPEHFESLSGIARNGILKALPKLFSVETAKSIIPELQNAISAFHAFKNSGVENFNEWVKQADMFNEGKTPEETYNPLELKIADILLNSKTEKEIKLTFDEYAKDVNDFEGDMFEPAKEGLDKKEAVDKNFNVKDYEGNDRKPENKNEVSGESKPKSEGTDGEREQGGTGKGNTADGSGGGKSITKNSSLDEISKWLDNAEKNLDQFGKENLSMGIPIVVAKLAIQAMKTALQAGKLASEIIQSGIDAVKQTDWYKNLTTDEQAEVEKDFLNKISQGDRQTENMLNRSISDKVTEDEAFDKFRETANKSRKELENKKSTKEFLREQYRKFITRFTDRQYTAKRLLDKLGLDNTKNLIINSHGASGKAKILFEEAYSKIYKKLSTIDRNLLDEIIQAKRFIAIDENREARGLEPVSHPNFIDKNISQKFLDKLKKEIGDEKFNDLEKRANEYFKTYKGLLNQMLENGLISKESFDAMNDVDYQPRVFLQFVTDFNGDLETNKKTNNLDSGGLSSDQIKAMSEGDASSLVMNSEWLLTNSLLARTKAMANNNINKRFITDEFQKAKKRFDALDPKNLKGDDARFYKYFKELNDKVIDNPIVGYTESGNPKYKFDKTPANFAKMYYYVDGVQHQFFLEKGLHESWNDNIGGFLSSDAKEFISYASGSALVKAIATGNNPAFLIVNTPRDFMFTLTFSDQYSSIVPKAMVQITKDVFKAVNEIRKKDSSVLKNYFDHGGAMDFLSSQGTLKADTKLGQAVNKSVSQRTKEVAKKIFSAVTLHKISAYSEMMFRLGIFQRSISNQLKDLGLKDISEVTDKQQREDIYNSAVASARGILDFNQGGTITKDLESVMPYINVAFQGGRVALNALEKDPVGTTARILQVATMASAVPIGLSLAFIGANKDDDDERSAYEIYLHAMDGISQYQKSKYMNIVTGKKDADGEYQVIKIAKAQELSPIISLTDNIYGNMIRKMAGKEKRSASLVLSDALFSFNSNVMPVDVTSPAGFFTRTPIAKATLTYATGYDFFREQPLAMKMEKKPSPTEGMEMKNVEDFYKKLGVNYGLSPVRSKAFVEALITSPDTNPFVGILYGGADAISSDKDAKQIGKKLFEDIYKSTGKRVVSYSSEFNRQLETNKVLEKKIEDIKVKDAVQKAEFKEIAQKYIDKELTKEDLNSKLMELEPNDRKRMVNKIKDKIKMQNVDGAILDIKYEQNSEAKALMIMHYYGDIFDGSEDSRKILIQMKRAGGVLTKDVRYEYNKLKEELKKGKRPN